jgi:hypothetical protein
MATLADWHRAFAEAAHWQRPVSLTSLTWDDVENKLSSLTFTYRNLQFSMRWYRGFTEIFAMSGELSWRCGYDNPFQWLRSIAIKLDNEIANTCKERARQEFLLSATP